jgi:hypothetical protein
MVHYSSSRRAQSGVTIKSKITLKHEKNQKPPPQKGEKRLLCPAKAWTQFDSHLQRRQACTRKTV